MKTFGQLTTETRITAFLYIMDLGFFVFYLCCLFICSNK